MNHYTQDDAVALIRQGYRLGAHAIDLRTGARVKLASHPFAETGRLSVYVTLRDGESAIVKADVGLVRLDRPCVG